MVSPSSRGFLGLDYGDFFVAQTTASEGIDESGCETIPNRIFVGGIAFRVSAREDTVVDTLVDEGRWSAECRAPYVFT